MNIQPHLKKLELFHLMFLFDFYVKNYDKYERKNEFSDRMLFNYFLKSINKHLF